jgi:hypothetical protein
MSSQPTIMTPLSSTVNSITTIVATHRDHTTSSPSVMECN